MNVSFGYCEDVLKTLPVGYYLGHPVAVRLNPTGDQTYIELDCERITVGFVNIFEACKNAPDIYDRETIIRSLFYHEISHAILTPNILMKCLATNDFVARIVKAFGQTITTRTTKKPNPNAIPTDKLDYIIKHLRDLINIVEDERIETRLASYYMNVDFKRLVVLLNGDPKNFCDRDPMGRFFAAVRYRHGDPVIVQEVKRIIDKYYGMTNETRAIIPGYCEDIVKLMYHIMLSMPEQSAQDEKPEQSAQDPNGQQSNQGEQKPLTDDEINQIVKAIEPFVRSFDNEEDITKIKTPFKEGSTNPVAAAVEAKVNKILMAALNKQKNQSSGSHGYAGRIDPRAVANRNYRWFAKKSQGSAVKRFNKVRFNLFVDSSSSFRPSQPAINALICALKKIEATNPDFSVRVAHCGDGTQIAPVDDPYVSCDNFSNLSADTKDKYDSLQTPNATNVNIVVFDGRMWGKCNHGNAYSAFNHPNCIIVSDDENELDINDYAPQAKSVIVSKDYEKVFTDIVLDQVGKLLA